MSPATPLALLLGALGGAGLWLLLLATLGPTAPTRQSLVIKGLGDRRRIARLAACAGAGALVWLVTGWPVAGLLATAGAWWLPGLLGPDRGHERQVARIEAVAAWTEQVRDLMASASGLQQAITTTAPIAPEPIRPAVRRLAERVRAGEPPEHALAEFAEAVDVPTADLVAVALASAASRHAADLGALLSSLARSTRDQAAMLVKIAASRARVRTAARIITATTVGLATLLIVANPTYLQPYDSPLGQLVLAVIGGLWAAALTWIVRLSRSDLGPRVLRGPPREATP